MSVLKLVNSLNAIWYFDDTENEKKQHIITQRNVKKHFENLFNNGVNLSAIPDEISDNLLSIDVVSSAPFSPSAFDHSRETCASGQLPLDDVIQSQLDGQEFDRQEDYIELCHRIGIALDVDTSDDEANPDYWSLAWQDSLSAYQAVIDSVNARKPATTLKQNTSTDYGKLFDCAMQDFHVPCRLTYKKDIKDYAVVKMREDNLCVSARGMIYFIIYADEVDQEGNTLTLKELFIRECEKVDLEWYDTFSIIEA